jgi:mitochondrial inner membrane protease subunit 1
MRVNMGDPPPSSDVPDVPEPTDESYRRGRSTVAGVVAALSVLAVAGWAFLRARPSRVAIEGPSMAPTLLPDDWVLVVTPRDYRRGDVVVVEHPGRPRYEMVKRLVGVPGDRVGERELGLDEYWVEGDFGQASTDSRHFGPVTREELRAKAVLVYWPAGRRRVIRREVTLRSR